MSTYTRVDESSKHHCPRCLVSEGKPVWMAVDIGQDDTTGEVEGQFYVCPVCWYQERDRQWWEPRVWTRRAIEMDPAEAERVLAEASPTVLRLREMRMG